MEHREQRFNPEFSFLEDGRILELDNLVNDTFGSFTKLEDKPKVLAELKEKWEALQREYIKMIGTNDTHIKNFLRFVNYNIKRMDAGGMNVGRSEIGNFINQKSEELTPYFDFFRKDL